MSLTIEEIKEHVANFTYKPGWEFGIKQMYTLMGTKEMALICLYPAPNSDNPSEMTSVMGYEMLETPVFTFGPFNLLTFDRLYLDRLIRKADQHEMEEWLRYKGERIVDPHPAL